MGSLFTLLNAWVTYTTDINKLTTLELAAEDDAPWLNPHSANFVHAMFGSLCPKKMNYGFRTLWVQKRSHSEKSAEVRINRFTDSKFLQQYTFWLFHLFTPNTGARKRSESWTKWDQVGKNQFVYLGTNKAKTLSLHASGRYDSNQWDFITYLRFSCWRRGCRLKFIFTSLCFYILPYILNLHPRRHADFNFSTFVNQSIFPR